MELEPEAHAHRHRSGHGRIDLLLALSALMLSIASMIVAIENHHSMKQLVTANSWPYLRHHSNNIGGNGEAAIELGLTNAGIGPALIEKFTMSYQGVPISNTTDLLLHCCAKDGGELRGMQPDLSTGEMNGLALSPREKANFLKLRKPAQGPALAVWEMLDKDRFKVETAVCYSSVLGEHWLTRSGDFRPRQVDSCDELPGPAYKE